MPAQSSLAVDDDAADVDAMALADTDEPGKGQSQSQATPKKLAKGEPPALDARLASGPSPPLLRCANGRLWYLCRDGETPRAAADRLAAACADAAEAEAAAAATAEAAARAAAGVQGSKGSKGKAKAKAKGAAAVRYGGFEAAALVAANLQRLGKGLAAGARLQLLTPLLLPRGANLHPHVPVRDADAVLREAAAAEANTLFPCTHCAAVTEADELLICDGERTHVSGFSAPPTTTSFL
jgi:hypothetical protein